MPALDITRCRFRHATLLGVAGEIDLATEPALRAALHPLPDEHLVVDLTAVGFLSAGGLRCLLDAHDRLRASRRTLVIVESPPVRRLITVTGLDRTLHTVGDRTAARALLSAGRHPDGSREAPDVEARPSGEDPSSNRSGEPGHRGPCSGGAGVRMREAQWVRRRSPEDPEDRAGRVGLSGRGRCC